MVKKTFLTALVLLGLQFCQMTGVCFADASVQLEQADTYKDNGDYLQAEEIYRTIIKEYPGTEEALMSQRGLAILYILKKRSIDAQAAIDKLTADFADYPEQNTIARAFFDIARQYEWSTKYKEANKLFQLIMDEYSGSWYINRANLAVARTNIMYLIEWGQYQKAQEAIDKLIADFPGHMDLPEAIYSFGKRYEWSNEYDKANKTYLQLVQKYPDSPWASQVPLSIPSTNIMSLIESDKETEAQAAIDGLLSSFSGHNDLPSTLDNIAHEYVRRGRYEEAKSLYQQMIQRYPVDSVHAGTAQLEASKLDVFLLIEVGKDVEAQTAIDKFTADFNDHSRLAGGVAHIAEQYQIKALRLENEGTAKPEEIRNCLLKAIAIWDKVINEYEDRVVVPQSCCEVGNYYRKLGEYEKSAEYYQKVADDYPGDRMAWHALFMVGRNYEDLGKLGLVPQSEADTKIKAAYEQVIEKYPDCKAAKAAKNWLNRHNSK